MDQPSIRETVVKEDVGTPGGGGGTNSLSRKPERTGAQGALPVAQA